MSTVYDLIIIGAGPSGLYTAAHCTNHNLSILVIEKNSSAGKKLLLSGSGQCNFTNIKPIKEFLTCYGDHGRFLKPALLNHTNQAVIDFFSKQGLPCMVIDDNGKVFPKSRRSQDILDTLLNQAKLGDVKISYNQPVKSLIKKPDHFEIHTTDQHYLGKQVLLAVGGQSFPQTGSSGDGYNLASVLGHDIVFPHPGLTPFNISSHPLSKLAGTSFKSLPITLFRDSKKIKTLVGSMVITHTGLSGPVIHNLSRYAKQDDKIKLHLFKSTNEDHCRKIWSDLIAQNQQKSIGQLLRQLELSKAFCDELCFISSINRLSKMGLLNKKQLSILFNHLLGLELTLENKGDFNIAMVTVGGINLGEINSKTMESKLIPKLFFAGEVMDIDGDTGGYDLQACWSTGFLASQSIIKHTK